MGNFFLKKNVNWVQHMRLYYVFDKDKKIKFM